MGLSELYCDLFGLTDEPLIQRLTQLGEIRRLKKGRALYREGERPAKVGFLVQGLLRGYFLDAGGRDITDCFAFEPGAPANASIVLGEPASINVEALEDTVVISFEARVLMPYLFRDPELMNICMARMADIYAEQILHKRMLCHTTAAERYRWFLDAYPGIIDRAPHRCIASFLNMTPVTLSRLRKEERLRWEVQ